MNISRGAPNGKKKYLREGAAVGIVSIQELSMADIFARIFPLFDARCARIIGWMNDGSPRFATLSG